jgi:hypothetical protein
MNSSVSKAEGTTAFSLASSLVSCTEFVGTLQQHRQSLMLTSNELHLQLLWQVLPLLSPAPTCGAASLLMGANSVTSRGCRPSSWGLRGRYSSIAAPDA